MNKLTYQLPWILVMFLLSLQSVSTSINLPTSATDGSDKVVHFLAYGVLGFTLVRGFEVLLKRYVVWSLIIGVVYSGLSEWIQSYIPGRSASLSDLIANVLGVIVCVLFWWNMATIRNKNEI